MYHTWSEMPTHGFILCAGYTRHKRISEGFYFDKIAIKDPSISFLLFPRAHKPTEGTEEHLAMQISHLMLEKYTCQVLSIPSTMGEQQSQA